MLAPSDDSQPSSNNQTDGQSKEELLEAPSSEDFLPPAEPHNSSEEHQHVEGEPGGGGPGQTLPQQDTPSPHVLPDSDPAGPPDEKPHEF